MYGNGYLRFRIEAKNLCRFFQRNNIKTLSKMIRAARNGEEITFEQVLITDNPPSNRFIIIDRQVRARENKGQMDLLALRRDSEGPFHFLVIEVKLGKNPELNYKVGEQLNDYVRHIRDNIRAYATCYKENYRQKKELGLFELEPRKLPDSIEINEDEKTVEGLVVVGGYTQRAEEAIRNLCHRIKDSGWDVKVQQMRREIRLDDGSYCEQP